MLSNYHEDIGKDGLTAEFKYLDKSADFFWVPPGYTTALNYDSVRTILEQNAPSLQTVKFHWKQLQVFPLSDEIASFTGIVDGQMIDTSGVESKVAIIESGTVIKRRDGWKLLCGQSAALNPNKKDDLFPQNGNALIDYFNDIRGLWKAIPSDSSFISNLEYRKGKDKYFMISENILSSKEGKVFTEYEGIYFLNPDSQRIEFTTMNKNEIHKGYCRINGDSLFHYAHISGKSKIKSYSSVLIKNDLKSSLSYFADYSESSKYPKLKFNQPLVYQKK